MCTCFNASYDQSVCRSTPYNGTLNGPSYPVQVALMLVSNTVACEPPEVSSSDVGSIPQGYSRWVVIQLNYTSPDMAEFLIIDQPRYGSLDLSLLASGYVKYRISDSNQYFYGQDSFSFAARQTGIAKDGSLSPCQPLQSSKSRVIIDITNVHDAPAVFLNVSAQPTPDVYGNVTEGQYIFDITLLENQPFAIVLDAQVFASLFPFFFFLSLCIFFLIFVFFLKTGG